jgi:hypothetical protein
VPVHGKANRHQNLVIAQKGHDAPIRNLPQFSKKDMLGATDDESKEPVHDDPLSMPAPVTQSTGALEGLMKQNPYLVLVPKVQVESLKNDTNLAELWGAVEGFVTDCEREMANLAYIRSTCSAFVEEVVTKTKEEDHLKMLVSKSEFLIKELVECQERSVEMMLTSEFLSRMMEDAAPFAMGDRHQLQALSSCATAKEAAWKDTVAALEKTQDKLNALLGQRPVLPDLFPF